MEIEKILRTIGAGITPGYGLTIIIFDTEDVRSEVRFKDCMARYEKLDSGIWLGNAFDKQGIFVLEQPAEQLTSKHHIGYIIEDGKHCMCRLIEEE